MKLKLNLLLILCVPMVIVAQNQTIMKNNMKSTTTSGQVIKNGKLIYSEISIKASPEKIWKVFTDFESYPMWNPFIKSLKGSPVVGNTIETNLQLPGKKAMTFVPKVLVYDSLKQFRWIGKFFIPRLFDGEHTFLIRDNEDGTCTFIQFENFRGLLIPFMKKMLELNTLDGFNKTNEALKARCEN